VDIDIEVDEIRTSLLGYGTLIIFGVICSYNVKNAITQIIYSYEMMYFIHQINQSSKFFATEYFLIIH
jgi:hypothetical protein